MNDKEYKNRFNKGYQLTENLLDELQQEIDRIYQRKQQELREGYIALCAEVERQRAYFYFNRDGGEGDKNE